ncbi:hypothetical protein SeMB42_g05396 [Synchytrium endobioticum]|uniref:Cyclin n=1 Tax=Synchytrium endobioticum TaxID=286115 RepID=A0A507CRP2_9FUNG|nr:hypothetical protein SeMB42_g05396 [Synchytrium endobioticum]
MAMATEHSHCRPDHRAKGPVFDLATPPQETMRLLAGFLTQTCNRNAHLPLSHLTRFHARTVPAIDLYAYLVRILKYAPCGTDCFLAVLIYLERMCHPMAVGDGPPLPRDPVLPPRQSDLSLTRTTLPLALTYNNVHRLLISTTMVAVKFLSDVFFTNLHLSRVGGLPVSELNALEMEVLILNGFNLSVTLEELQEGGNLLLRTNMAAAATDEALKCKLFTSKCNHDSTSPSQHLIDNRRDDEWDEDEDESHDGHHEITSSTLHVGEARKVDAAIVMSPGCSGWWFGSFSRHKYSIVPTTDGDIFHILLLYRCISLTASG